MRRLWWLSVPLAVVVAIVVWSRDDTVRRASRPMPVDPKAPAVADATWLVAVDASGRRLKPNVVWEEDCYVIRCPGYVTEVYRPRSDDPRPLKITLTPAPTLRGRVVLPGGEPAVGVRIDGYAWHDACTTRTGEDGRFELRDLEPESLQFLDVSLPGFLPPEITCRPGDDVFIPLGEGGALRGTVVDREGAPVIGARVLLRGHFLYRTECDAEAFAVLSGPEGRFEFRGLDEEVAYRVVARDNERNGSVAIAAIDAERVRGPVAGAEKVRSCTVVVRERPRLRVRVIDPEGVPIEHVRIDAGHEAFASVGPGVYVSGPLPPGTQTLSFDVEGWSARVMDVRLDRVEERTLDVRFRDAHTLRAQIVDDRGTPVVGASVSSDVGAATTDAEGRFMIRGLAASPVALAVEHDGHKSIVLTAAPTSGSHRITMTRAATIIGRLEPAPVSRLVQCRVFATEFDTAGSRVDVFGRFAIHGLPSNAKCDITFEVEGWVAVVMRDVTLAPGEVRHVGVLRPPPGATLEGVVRDNYGRVVDGARVDLRSQMQEVSEWTITGASGSYRFTDLPRTKAALAVYGPGLVSRTLEVELGRNRVLDISVIRAGRLTGIAMAGDELRLVPVVRGAPLRWTAEADGTFSVRPAPGRYRVQYRVDDRWADARPVRIVEGEGARVAVTEGRSAKDGG